RANTGNSISAAGDITRPAVGAATVAATSGGMPGHITQGQSYFAYANVTDGGSGMSTVTADLSPITSGQTAAAYGTAGGPFSYRGTSYTYRTASQTAGASLSQCRYTYPVVSTDAAGNVSRTDQQAMVDRQIGAAGTYYTRIDGAAAGDDLGDDQGTATAGDVNGDGRPDLLLGADYATYSGRSGSGAAYVVFGQARPGRRPQRRRQGRPARRRRQCEHPGPYQQRRRLRRFRQGHHDHRRPGVAGGAGVPHRRSVRRQPRLGSQCRRPQRRWHPGRQPPR